MLTFNFEDPSKDVLHVAHIYWKILSPKPLPPRSSPPCQPLLKTPPKNCPLIRSCTCPLRVTAGDHGDDTRVFLFDMYMGGCQNYGPFLDPYYNTAPNI